MSYYWHHVPGRLRLKTPSIKGNEVGAVNIQVFLKQFGGVLSTAVNTVTGSLVINYDPQVIDSESLTHNLSRAGYFDRTKAITNDQYIFSKASSLLNFVALFV